MRIAQSYVEICTQSDSGQKLNRGTRKLKATAPRLVGVAVTAALLAAFVLVLRMGQEEPAPGPAAARGGQIVASIRGEPRTFNRYVGADQASEVLSLLLQARLVRINGSSFELEPWLAEKWESSPDARTQTIHLRPGLTWSDGMPLTAEDVLFSLRAFYDTKV